MKKILFPLGIAAMLSIAGCSEDFDVAAPYKNITVVYGILNQQDTSHYIRIQKAFLDEDKSAIDMAKVPDSSYFPELNVTFKEFHETGALLRTTKLERVDLAMEGYPKNAPGPDAGFFTTPSYAYKFKWTLNSYSNYRIVIQNPKTGSVDSAEVTIVNADPDNTGSGFYVDDFNIADNNFDFSATGANTVFTFATTRGITGTIPNKAKLVQATFRFHYADRNAVSNDTTYRSIDYLAYTDVKENNADYDLNIAPLSNAIFSFLTASMSTAPANTERYMGKVDVFLVAADEALYQYHQVNLAQTGGITADQIKPYYTNIKGSNNAVGLVASRTYHNYFGAILTETTLNRLKGMASLNIRGRYQ